MAAKAAAAVPGGLREHCCLVSPRGRRVGIEANPFVMASNVLDAKVPEAYRPEQPPAQLPRCGRAKVVDEVVGHRDSCQNTQPTEGVKLAVAKTDAALGR